MGDDGPLGNPFEGMPFLGDLAKMLGQQGGMAWDSARQLAISVATDGTSEPNVDPVERMGLEQLARVADLHVADVTGLSTSLTGRPVVAAPVNRTGWVMASLDAYRPLMERLAAALGPDAQATEAEPEDAGDPMAGMLAGMLKAFQPMMLAMTAGSMVGHLARRSLGQYDLPIPRPASGAHPDELLLVVPNLDEFATEWSLARDDLRLWVCVHEIAHHTVFAVPHVRARMDDLLARHVSSFRSDPGGFEGRLDELDLSDPSSPGGLQELMGSPEVILGAITSPEQEALRPQMDALVAVVVGVVDHVLDTVGAKLIGSYGMLTEALRRRRVEAAESDRFVERLFGLELTQATYDRGSRFVEGVIERAGDDGLRRLWADEANLPTPNEVDAPGLWLARLDL
ncbi:MAG TPA: zinc-dependent metalloprotease [Acidimicrobiales bacterium]|nr:zinc-dependent metalloprotease [Acidimicrobiales bacterium]